MTSNELMQPFYDYLMAERSSLLERVDAIERILGTSPRTSELRKSIKKSAYLNCEDRHDTIDKTE